MIVVIAGSGAWAEDHVVVKPGIMCRSSAALAILTLPGGDSRTHRLPPRDRDLTTAGKGGCQDLRIGQFLNVVKMFRNTAIVTLVVDKPWEGPPAFYIAPTIDLAPASGRQSEPTTPPSQVPRFRRDESMSEMILTSLIGQDEDVFIKAHPEGDCSDPQPGVESCVYQAVGQGKCPVAFRCSNAIYEFHHGRMTSFQTGLSLERDWKAAYRLAQEHYPVLKRARTAAGESTFFETGGGILGFGHTFVQNNGSSPAWEISFSLAASAAEAE